MFGSGAAAQYAAMLQQKTGLHAQDNRMVGYFQGLPAWTRTEMVANTMGALRGNGGMLGGLGMLLGGSTGGMAHAMTGGSFFMKYDFVIELPGNRLPGGSLRETTSFMIDKSLQQRQAIGGRVQCGVPWIDSKYEVCSYDPSFMPYVCSSPELQQHLQRWPYLNLSWEAERVWLEMIESPTRINTHFSTAEQQNGDMILRGLWTVAAAARATFAR